MQLLANKSISVIMKFSSACVSALLVPAATARLSVANRLDVRPEPNRISNIDCGFKNNSSINEGVMTSLPTTDIADSGSSSKEECSPPVTVSKTNKIDAGNLPLSSCSSSKMQICLKNVMKSSSSMEKTGVCTDINNVPISYWDSSYSNASSSDIPVLYWEDAVSAAIPTGHATTQLRPREVLSKISIYDNNSASQLSGVEEQLDHY
jgi:hypothetical protein